MMIPMSHQNTIRMLSRLAIFLLLTVGTTMSLVPLRPVFSSRSSSTSSTTTPSVLVPSSRRNKALHVFPADSVLKMVFSRGSGKNSVESGIQAAMILTDMKRQEEWKKDMSKEYPMIPTFVIDICVDSLANAFSSIAPAEFQAVLKPGGLEKARPTFEQSIIRTLEQQDAWKGIPLKQEDKRQFLEYLVTMALDYILKDAEVALTSPTTKLQTLNQQKREIQRYMTRRQLLSYRIQTYPRRTMLIVATCIYITYTLYEATKHTWAIMTMSKAMASLVSYLTLTFKKSLTLFGLGPKETLKKKAFRQVLRR